MASNSQVATLGLAQEPSPANLLYTDFYVHPEVYLATDPIKGTGTISKVDIKKGTVILMDNPYSLVPKTSPIGEIQLLCSRLRCSRKVVVNETTSSCPNNCSKEVVWCDSNCQQLGKQEHDYECAWLKIHGKSIREKYGLEFEDLEEFYRVWLVVRTLAQHHLEAPSLTTSMNASTTTGETFSSDWNAVSKLCSNEDILQPQKLTLWRTLVDKYLVGKHALLLHTLDADQMLALMCQIETNNFDLLPHPLGAWPPTSPSIDRKGGLYAYAMYLRTPFLNHSCIPNVSFFSRLLVSL